VTIRAGDGKTANLVLQCIVILKDENEDLTSGQEQRLRRMEREYERRQQVVFSLIQVEGKQFTLSLNICPEVCCRKGWGRAEIAPPPLTTTLFPS
jgi:hypothetical protein